MKNVFAIIIGAAVVCTSSAGCVCRARSMQTDSRHFFKYTPEEVDLLVAGLEREAEFIISEIKGPLRDEIIAYFYHQVLEIGPLVYQTRSFAQRQFDEIPIVADQVVKCLVKRVRDEYKILVRQIRTYAEGEIAEFTPLHESFRKFLRHQYGQIDEFVHAVKRYEEVNMAEIGDLGLSVERYFKWQLENAREIPDSTERYIRKISDDFEDVMNSSGRYLAFNLRRKPVEMRKTLMRYAKYNMEELIPQLKRSTGRYLWHQIDEIPELTKEIYCFTNKNLEETRVVICSVQKYFAVNVEKTEELSKEVFRFFKWRTEQWKMMKKEMDRFISFNIDKLDMLAECPVRYIQHQKEEWERLKEVVPQYFLYNISKGEGLAFAIKRYISTNIGPDSGNCHN